jgi:hypothetical protein
MDEEEQVWDKQGEGTCVLGRLSVGTDKEQYIQGNFISKHEVCATMVNGG